MVTDAIFLPECWELTSWKQVISLNAVSLMSSVGLKGCVCVEVDPLALKEQMQKGMEKS